MDGHYAPSVEGGGASHHVVKGSFHPPASAIDAAKIFVGGLSWQTTEEALRYHFEQYGEVVSVEVMRDRNTGDPRGFAFVVFREDATVELVMNEGRHEINHKVVDVKRAQARGVAPPSIHGGAEGAGGAPGGHVKQEGGGHKASRGGADSGGLTPEQLQNKVFVGGIPLSIDRDQLREHFEKFGTVVDAIVMMDPIQRRSRGFGFVTFENGSGGAQRAMASQPIAMQGKYVEVKLATPKGEQKDGAGGGAGRGHYGKGGFQHGGGHAPGGLRGSMASASASGSTGEFAGLAAAYGRNGWKAGYGTKAFGAAGWAVRGWDDGGEPPERTGFSFEMLKGGKSGTGRRSRTSEDAREVKRARH